MFRDNIVSVGQQILVMVETDRVAAYNIMYSEAVTHNTRSFNAAQRDTNQKSLTSKFSSD